MTVSQMFMHIRKNKSRREEVTNDGELPEFNCTLPEKTNNANQIISRLQLNEAIAQLADGYRKVVILHDIQGFEHEELAKMLGCAFGTSKSQLHKARQVLRRLLTSGNASTRRTLKAID